MADTGPFPHCHTCNLSFKDRRALIFHSYTNKHKETTSKAGYLQPHSRNMSRSVAVPRTGQDFAPLVISDNLLENHVKVPSDELRDNYDDASESYHCNICNMAYSDERGLKNHVSYSLPHLRRLREAAAQKSKPEHIESGEILEGVRALTLLWRSRVICDRNLHVCNVQMTASLSIREAVPATRTGESDVDAGPISEYSNTASESDANTDNELDPVQGSNAPYPTPNTTSKSNKGGELSSNKKKYNQKSGKRRKLWCDVCECKQKPGAGVRKHKNTYLHRVNRMNRLGF
ncbi:hypothetical protein K440DRAFT_642170 [Wilcoxina mikolae CBS 423.85]|nr:hypothetical protein K440DRAFT_642170 [Wilcoxina mikolae CBS 423.85]